MRLNIWNGIPDCIGWKEFRFLTRHFSSNWHWHWQWGNEEEKEGKWKYIRLPITGLAAGRKTYQSHSWRAKTTCSKLVEYSHILYKRGTFDDVQNCNQFDTHGRHICPTPMGHKAKLLTSNFSWQRCFHIFTELRKSRLDAKIIMRHMLAQFLTFCKMSSRSTCW